MLGGRLALLLLLRELPEGAERLPLAGVVVESNECVDEHRNDGIIRLLDLFLQRNSNAAQFAASTAMIYALPCSRSA